MRPSRRRGIEPRRPVELANVVANFAAVLFRSQLEHIRDVVRVDCVLEPLEEGLGAIRLNLNDEVHTFPPVCRCCGFSYLS